MYSMRPAVWLADLACTTALLLLGNICPQSSQRAGEVIGTSDGIARVEDGKGNVEAASGPGLYMSLPQHVDGLDDRQRAEK